MTEEVLKSVGRILESEWQRDAVHFALAPVIAAHKLDAGDHVGLNERGEATEEVEPIGIIDPFLTSAVKKGQRCWLFLYPGSIKSLRHEWSHEAFGDVAIAPKAYSERWMREWATKHMGEDYYDTGKWTPDDAYRFALEAGETYHIGCYEYARDHIDAEWWRHWETITGKSGDRGAFFSCSC